MNILHHFAELFVVLPVMGSFLNLFGGDKKEANTTNLNTSTDNSVTKSNSDNISNWLQQNLAQITNSTRINNTNLENTDSFNRTAFTILSDVGNIQPGTPVSPALDSVGIQNMFASVLSSPVLAKNAIAKDPNKNPMDFAGISSIATQVIDSSGKNQLGTYYQGITDLSKATSPTYAPNNPNASPVNSPWFWPVVAGLGIVALFLAFRPR